VLGLTTHLRRTGQCSVVATDPRGELYRRLRGAGLAVRPLPVRNHLDLYAGYQLRRLVRTERYDLVHFHTARAHALSPWLNDLGIPRVVTRRMDYPIKGGWFTRWLYTGCVNVVVAISDGVRAALLAGGIPAAHIRLIPSGIDTARFVPDSVVRARTRAALGVTEQDIVVLSVGALTERKSHQTLLQAAHGIRQRGHRLRYLICGDGPLRAALEKEVRALELTPVVQFAGFCSDVIPYLAAADVFVHVPVWEGLGIAVIEALAAGLPVIASRVGGIPELIDDHTTGVLVPAQDPYALADALDRLARDREWAKTLGQAGQYVARSRFDIAVMAEANMALYRELLSPAFSPPVAV
jgi:glycosyltransferase involved in cell wall biosynthesis